MDPFLRETESEKFPSLLHDRACVRYPVTSSESSCRECPAAHRELQVSGSLPAELGTECEPLLHDVQGKAHLIPCHEGTKGRYRYSSTLSLTSAIGGGEWSTSHPGRFTPGRIHAAHCKEGWIGPRACLDRCVKSRPYQDSIPRTVQPVASCFTN